MNPFPKLADLVATYRRACTRPTEVCVHYQVVVAPEREEARRIARESLNRYIGINNAARSQAQDAHMQALAHNIDYGARA